MRIRRFLFATGMGFIFAVPFFAAAQEAPPQKPELIFFYASSCHECSLVKSGILPEAQKRFAGKIDVRLLEIGDIENYKLLVSLKERYGFQGNSVPPVLFIGGEFLVGEPEIRKGLIPLIERQLAKAHAAPPVKPGSVDLERIFRSFSLLAVIGAGLIDGVNPCAFTVIVFFISYLGLQGYRRRNLAVIGVFYIAAVFITYLLIGLGLFKFLYSIEQFWLVRKVFNAAVGILSLVFGILALYDFVKFRKTGSAEGMALQLPQAVKNRIHAVIGAHYRKPSGRQQTAEAAGKISLAKLVVSALITGFLVSILESICTGQVYLPTITLVLKTTNIKLQALGYLLVYNVMFIVPLFVVFALALWGMTSRQFTQFLNRHMLTVKALMVVLFFGLGAYLIWRA
jgi:cytochrome c biogenesis protein CcdA